MSVCIVVISNNDFFVLQAKLAEIYGGANFKMAFIIVTKRINSRFFLDRRNPLPGTVVDDCVTLPER